jgi:excisionase family DNA binding protein
MAAPATIDSGTRDYQPIERTLDGGRNRPCARRTDSCGEDTGGEAAHVSLEGWPDVLTVAEAAKALRIGRNAAYEAVQMKKIPSFRLGSKIRIPKLALERALAKMLAET